MNQFKVSFKVGERVRFASNVEGVHRRAGCVTGYITGRNLYIGVAWDGEYTEQGVTVIHPYSSYYQVHELEVEG
jgi:hypothetical protein